MRRLADALRGCGIVERLGARDGGRGRRARRTRRRSPVNRAAIPGYTRRAGRRGSASCSTRASGRWCSAATAASCSARCSRCAGAAATGWLHVDGHLDFRHPGWSGGIGAVAGEDLAGVTGRLEPALSDIDGLGPVRRRRRRRPLRRPRGRPGRARGGRGDRHHRARPGARCAPGAVVARACRTGSTSTPTCSTARCCPRSTRPAPDGLTFEELAALLRALLAGDAVGLQVTVFDPDLDPTARRRAR